MMWLLGAHSGPTRWEGTGMAYRLRASTAGIRVHQFVAGNLPVIAYLSDWPPPLWVAFGLSMLALVCDRLVVVDWLVRGQKHSYEREDPGPHAALFRLDEAMRVILLGGGAVLLTAGYPIGRLPTLAASAATIMEGTTAFSFTLLVYTFLRRCLQYVRPDMRAGRGEEGSTRGTPIAWCAVSCKPRRTAGAAGVGCRASAGAAAFRRRC